MAVEHYIWDLKLDDFILFANSIAKGFQKTFGKEDVSSEDKNLITTSILTLGKYMVNHCYERVNQGWVAVVLTKQGDAILELKPKYLTITKKDKVLFNLDFENEDWSYSEKILKQMIGIMMD